MNLKDKKFIEFLNIARPVGEIVTYKFDSNDSILTVVNNESFAFMVIKEISSTKYLYDLDAPMLYCTHYGMIPEKYDKCKELINDALVNLGFNRSNK